MSILQDALDKLDRLKIETTANINAIEATRARNAEYALWLCQMQANASYGISGMLTQKNPFYNGIWG